MLKEIIISFEAFKQAHQFIKKNKLWKWIIIPGLIYTILFILGFNLFLSSYDQATKWMFEELHLSSWLDRFENSWLSFFLIIGKIFIDLLLLFAYFSFYKFFFLIIASPVFAYLSEKTECLITGRPFSISIYQFLKDIARGVLFSIKSMSWQMVYVIGLLIVATIPLIGWITPLIFVFIDCYYLGFYMLDYSNGRNNLNNSESSDLISHHRGLAIGNGIIFYLFHIIPILGWIFAPSYAVIAATLSLHQAKEKKILFNR